MTRLTRGSIAVAAALAAGALLTSPARPQSAFSPEQRRQVLEQLGSQVPPEQRRQVEEIVGEYLVKNPDVLRKALAEAMRQEEAQQAAAQKDAVTGAAADLVKPSSGMVLGNPNGDVTLVEFSDYNCSFCKKAVADVRALVKEDPKLRVIVRDLDFIGGPISDEANKIASAVRSQASGDKLLDYHVKLMETRGRVNGERALAVAKELGLDIARLQKDGASPETLAGLKENDALARRLGVNGTPAFIVGNEIISGAVGIAPLREAIAATRKCGHAIC